MAIDSAKAREKIESIEDLPTLPSVVGKIIELANSPSTNAADVGRMIEQDQALTSKVLKLVNSAFYGFPGQIRSVQHAVVIMGFNKVKNVVLAASIFDLSTGRASNCLDIPHFWEHSLGTAIGGRLAAQDIGGGIQPDDAFVAGLLHSIGSLIMDQYLSREYRPAFELAQRNKMLLVDAEKEVLGFTHCQVGNWIAEKWRLPASLQHSIRFYPSPANAREDREMVAAVHCGNVFCRALGIGHPGDDCMLQLDPTVLKAYNLKHDWLDRTLGSILSELSLAKGFLDLIES